MEPLVFLASMTLWSAIDWLLYVFFDFSLYSINSFHIYSGYLPVKILHKSARFWKSMMDKVFPSCINSFFQNAHYFRCFLTWNELSAALFPPKCTLALSLAFFHVWTDAEHNLPWDSALPPGCPLRYSPGTSPVSLAVVSFFTSSFWLLIHAHRFFFRCSSAWLHHPSTLRCAPPYYSHSIVKEHGSVFSSSLWTSEISLLLSPLPYRGTLGNKKTHSTKHMTVSFQNGCSCT